MNARTLYTSAGVFLLAFAVFAVFSWGMAIALISVVFGVGLILVGQSKPKRKRHSRRY